VNKESKAVLGIDAAWTQHNPSGVALLRRKLGRWQCVAAAPSYDAFIALSKGASIDWNLVPQGSALDGREMLAASEKFLGDTVEVIAVDMPIATVPVTGRREADQSISKRFGAQGCAVHTPNPIRPGPVGEEFLNQFVKLGFRLATTETAVGQTQSVVEVYPHPALLRLLNAPYRICYKKGPRSKRLPELQKIKNGLSREIDGICLELPDEVELGKRKGLKRYEDTLDALVCAWIAAKFLDGCAAPYGDSTAAIWVPE